jgi:hypothetical protein
MFWLRSFVRFRFEVACPDKSLARNWSRSLSMFIDLQICAGIRGSLITIAPHAFEMLQPPIYEGLDLGVSSKFLISVW